MEDITNIEQERQMGDETVRIYVGALLNYLIYGFIYVSEIVSDNLDAVLTGAQIAFTLALIVYTIYKLLDKRTSYKLKKNELNVIIEEQEEEKQDEG